MCQAILKLIKNEELLFYVFNALGNYCIFVVVVLLEYYLVIQYPNQQAYTSCMLFMSDSKCHGGYISCCSAC